MIRANRGGLITGIQTDQKNKHNLRIFPYGTLRYENSDTTGVYDKVKALVWTFSINTVRTS